MVSFSETLYDMGPKSAFTDVDDQTLIDLTRYGIKPDVQAMGSNRKRNFSGDEDLKIKPAEIWRVRVNFERLAIEHTEKESKPQNTVGQKAFSRSTVS